MKEASLPLQTSPTLRELPPRAPAFTERRIVSLCIGRVLLGKVFVVLGRWEFWKSAASHSFCMWDAFGYNAIHEYRLYLQVNKYLSTEAE